MAQTLRTMKLSRGRSIVEWECGGEIILLYRWKDGREVELDTGDMTFDQLEKQYTNQGEQK